MKTPSKLFIVTTKLLLSLSASSAQDIWQVILKSGDTLTVRGLDSLHDNILSTNNGTSSFPVDSIAALIKQKEDHFLTGAILGTLGGAVAGGCIGAVTNGGKSQFGGISVEQERATEIGGLFGAIGGFVIGGVIGTPYPDSETFDLKRKTLREKLYIIEQILSK
jgi:hypothetical protein